MGISILGMVNALSPKGCRSRRIASGVPYGKSGRQVLDIYGPCRMIEAAPVVIFLYGGSWQGGDRRNYEFAARALADLGVVVAVPDYRMLPEVEYPVFLEDCAAAFAFVADNIGVYGGNGRRIALMGHSSGAYNAMMLALDKPYLRARGYLERVRCLVGLAGPYDFFPFDSQIVRRTFAAVPDPKGTQPINNVSATAPPMLLATGDRDETVLPRNTVAMAERLRALGVPVVEKHYDGLGHDGPVLALGRALRFAAPVFSDVADFLRFWLIEPSPAVRGDGKRKAESFA